MSTPRRHVFMFKPRFAPFVIDGTKTTTVRPPRKREVRDGDILDLRMWEGRPYASKQIKLREVACVAVRNIIIEKDANGVVSFIVGGPLGVLPVSIPENRSQFARDDGFSSFDDMVDWLEENHGLPFMGVRYRWEEVRDGR